MVHSWQARRGQERFGRPEARLPVRFGWLFALAFIACLTHPALDWLNTYGVRLLEPFSHRWFYGDTLFIVDIWLWLGMGLATWLSLRREKRGGEWRRPARIALVGVVAYIGANYAISMADRALDTSFENTISMPQPIAFWRRQSIGVAGNSFYPEGRKLGDLDLARCDLAAARRSRPGLDAFLFWSRAPFAERAADGSVLIRDARFADPLTRDRFTVALTELRCRPQSAHAGRPAAR